MVKEECLVRPFQSIPLGRNLLTLRIGEILWCPLLQSITAAQNCLNLTVNFLSSSAVEF